MNDHYFTDNALPDPATERSFNLHFRSSSLTFTSNEGLFSYGEADPNSLILMRTVSLPLISRQPRLLDLGCGWGLIGVTLAKAYGYDLTMSDVNGSALFYAEKNAAANKVPARIIKSNGFEAFDENDLFDIITLNPPIHAGKDVCYQLYADAAKHLSPSGAFFAVFMDKHGGASHKKKLLEIFPDVREVYRANGVTVAACRNKKPT
jgi:16S rRNA (guanine1207-N2)-methyltransferase